jgi:hypothetical protein
VGGVVTPPTALFSARNGGATLSSVKGEHQVKRITSRAIIVLSAGLVVSIVFNFFIGYLFLDSRRVADQIRVWRFAPTAAVTEQISRDGMSPQGRFLYLASSPKVQAKRDFNETCSAVTIDTSILGCYLETSKRIYLYHVTDPRLDGTEEVMAAHEMLRAAWDRMTAAQRAPLLARLQRVLATNNEPNFDLAKQMASVRHDDPADYDGELYATVGTEASNIGPVLESSYSQYFVRRSTVTALYAHANAYLVALRQKVDALVANLNSLNDTINSEVTAFNSAADALDSDVSSFNARAERPGGFSSEYQFDVARAALIARQDTLQATVTQINAQIDVFNGDLTKLKALDKTALSLVKSLNIELEPLSNVISA